MAQKWVGVMGSLRIDEQENVTLEIPRESPWYYRDFMSVYNAQYSDEISPHWFFDHAIHLVNGKQLPSGLIHALSEKGLQELRGDLDTMLMWG